MNKSAPEEGKPTRSYTKGFNLPECIMGFVSATVALVLIGGTCWCIYIFLAISILDQYSGSIFGLTYVDVAFTAGIILTLGFFVVVWWAAYKLLSR